jgi:L,D-peptidoglycan transpeptidase YkuD (ErfK/YbiS/YcfS/YnhG family)
MEILVRSSGVLSCQDERFRCALGRGGLVQSKKEGDGATPIGRFRLRRAFYRADRTAPPETSLPIKAIEENDGWCDDPDDPLYNQFIERPYRGRNEALWRKDSVYDVIVVIGYNDDPVVASKGSAIFLHVATPGYDPTEGCVALSLADLLATIKACDPNSFITIETDETESA